MVEIALAPWKIKESGAALYFFFALLALLGLANPFFALASAVLFAFIVPGFVLFKALSAFFGEKYFSALEKLFLAIASSVALSAFSTAFIFKFGSAVIALAFLATALPLLFLEVSLKKEFEDLKRDAKKHAPAIALSVFSFAFVFFVLSNSLWVPSQGGVLSNGWNWSDFLVHHAIIKSVLNGNFQPGTFLPQTPFFAGTPLVYHWFADFHTVLLASPGVFSIIDLAVFENSFYALLLALGVYLLAFRLTGSRKIALLAGVLVVFGGGMGYLKFFQDFASGGNPAELLASHSYDNNWESGWNFLGVQFKIPSVLGAGLLAWRAMAAGLPILLASSLLLLCAFSESDSKKEGVLAAFAGLVAGAGFMYHFYLLPAAMLLAASVFALKALDNFRELKRFAFAFAGFAAMSAIMALPYAFAVLLRVSSSSGFFPNIGWESKATDAFSFIAFYALNLGVPFILALFAIALFLFKVFKREKRAGEKWIAVLGLWAFSLFLVPNIVSFSAIAWDMNKFFSFMWVPVCILAASVLAGIWDKRGLVGKSAVAILLAASVLSPLLVSAWFVSGHWMALSSGQVRAAEWIEENTPKNAVFATAATINEPTDLAGRLRIITFPPYASNLGLDVKEREADLRLLYCGSPENAAGVMEKYGATYVIDDYERGGGCGHEFAGSGFFEKVFEDGGVRIYEFVSPT